MKPAKKERPRRQECLAGVFDRRSARETRPTRSSARTARPMPACSPPGCFARTAASWARAWARAQKPAERNRRADGAAKAEQGTMTPACGLTEKVAQVRLKRLEIYGFKSFADRTVVVFDEGHHRHCRPERQRQINLSDAVALGARRAERQGAARRQDGGRHLQRHAEAQAHGLLRGFPRL